MANIEITFVNGRKEKLTSARFEADGNLINFFDEDKDFVVSYNSNLIKSIRHIKK